MKQWQDSRILRHRAFCSGIGLSLLLFLTGCGSQKAKPVALNNAPTPAQSNPALVGGASGTPNPHPWIGSQPPPGSAMPPGGPKIPQK